MPQVIFTDPEVAAAGMSADQAREGGLDVRVLDYDIGKVAGAGLSPMITKVAQGWLSTTRATWWSA